MKRRISSCAYWFRLVIGLGCWGAMASIHLQATEAMEVVSSPYQGHMTAEEKAAATTSKPPIDEARWVHEAALMAYEAQLQLDTLETQVAAAQAQVQQQADAAKRKGEPADQIETRRAQQLKLIDEQATKMRAQYERYTRNIPKIHGVFFRPAIEAAVANGNFSPDNAFAKLLKGGTLEGVSLTDDQTAFAHSAAWRSIGGLNERKTQYAFRPWWLERRPESTKLKLDDPRYQQQFAESDNLAFFESTREADLVRWATATTPGYIISGTIAFLPEATEPAKDQYGAWHVSIELMRAAIKGADPEQIELAEELSGAAGLTAELGPLVQYPRLHFQARLDDVLMADTEIPVFVSRRDGSTARLESAATVELALRGAPTMVTSYASQRVHASMVPTAADWALIRASDAISILLAVPLMREDGVPDYITLPMSLTGFSDALGQLESAQRNSLQSLAGIEARHAQVLAAAQPRIDARARRVAENERERQQQLAALEAELRAFVSAHSPEAGLPNFPTQMPNPSRSSEVKDFNARLKAEFDNWDKWFAGYKAARADLYAFGARFWKFKVAQADAAGGLLQAQLNHWERVAKQGNANVKEVNRRIAATNQVTYANNDARNSSRRDADTGRFRRRTKEEGPSEADKFFEAQTKPYKPYFRDVDPPPKPTHYIGNGYY